MINILPQLFLYFFYVIELYQSLFGILLLLDQGNEVLKRLHGQLLDFLVVFWHENTTQVVDQFDRLLNRKWYAVVFELLEDLVDLLPVETRLYVGLLE